MAYEHFDAGITEHMQEVVVLLEDQDLVPAEAGMRSISEQVRAASPEGIREQKLFNLRQQLQSGIRHIHRVAPFTAVIRFRKALKQWVAG